jgi:hypothetical protein
MKRFIGLLTIVLAIIFCASIAGADFHVMHIQSGTNLPALEKQVGQEINEAAKTIMDPYLREHIVKDRTVIIDGYPPSQETSLISTTVTEISFTYESADYPWTPDELAILQTWIADFYPNIQKLMGPPAESYTVNIRQNPDLGEAALFFYTGGAGEIVLPRLGEPHLPAHEMIHAFRGRRNMQNAAFEEGMTRAIEVALFNLLPQYEYYNRHHSYGIDIYYEANNQPGLGAKNGNFFTGFINTFERYQQAGYAWWKCIAEDPRFMVKFHRAYYAQAARNPSITANTDILKSIARNIKPLVEGLLFNKWWAKQYIFNFAPPVGYQLIYKKDTDTLYLVYRSPSGFEQMISGENVLWTIFDYNENIILSDVTTTNDWGWFSIPGYFPNYQGRLRIEAKTTTPEGEIVQSFWSYTGPTNGLFGISTKKTTGSVIIGTTQVPIVNGAFIFPDMYFSGKIKIIHGLIKNVRTVDSSGYFVLMKN